MTMPKAKSTYWKVTGPDRYEYGDTLPDGTTVKVGEGDYATAFSYAWQINGPTFGKRGEKGKNFLRLISSQGRL